MKVFYTAVGKVKGGAEHTFIVTPGLDMMEDKRTPDEIARDAANKGYDVSYCQIWVFNVPTSISRLVSTKLKDILKKKYPTVTQTDWNFEVDVVNKVLVP